MTLSPTLVIERRRAELAAQRVAASFLAEALYEWNYQLLGIRVADRNASPLAADEAPGGRRPPIATPTQRAVLGRGRRGHGRSRGRAFVRGL